MSVILPKEVVKASTSSPELLILFSAPKTGKTTLASQLPNNLIIDLENGSNHVDALKIKAESAEELYEICSEIKKKKDSEGKEPYDYITLDTATALEDMVLPVALKLYQGTSMGKSYKGDILSLPNGAGYKYVRDAYRIMLNEVRGAAKRVILLGHVKDKVIEKTGKEVIAKELDLTGKLSSLTCSWADAIGFVYREGNKNMVTFNSASEVTCGARPQHLRNASFVLSEETEPGVIKTYWEKIYID